MSLHHDQVKHAREPIEPSASVSTESVGRVLDAAAIPRARTGGQRTATLAAPERQLSRDPASGGEVRLRIDPGDGARWDPEQAVFGDLLERD